MEPVLGLDPWVGYLIIALVVTYTLSIGGWALAKAGRSPIWILFLLLPYVSVAVVWIFAYIRWPGLDRPKGDRPKVDRAGLDQPDASR